MQISKYMQVIFNTIYTIKMTAFILYQSCNIAIKLIYVILFNSGPAVFCSENKVIQMLMIT